MAAQSSPIDLYIAGFPKDVQKILKAIRKTIRKIAPGAEEKISYGIPSYRLERRYIAHFAAFKKHIGFYPPVPSAFKKEVTRYANPKGNLQFPLDEPIPLDLIERIVLYRVQDIATAPGKKKR